MIHNLKPYPAYKDSGVPCWTHCSHSLIRNDNTPVLFMNYQIDVYL